MYFTSFLGKAESNEDIDEEMTRPTTIADELNQMDFIDENAATDCSGSDINSCDQEWAATCSNELLEVPGSYVKQGKLLARLLT